MLSRPLAFGLVAAACVVAAGGGAYIATLQHARSDSAIAASQQPAPAKPLAPSASPATSPEIAPPEVLAPPRQPSPDDVPAAGASTRQDDRPAGTRPMAKPGRAVREQRSVRTQAAEAHAEPRVEEPVAAPPVSQAEPSAGGHPATGGAVPPGQLPVPAPSDVSSKDQPRQEPEKAWEEVTIPADSVLGLQLETPLSSETARVEDRVDARVTRDVHAGGRVAIPAGTHAIGSVTLVERGGKIRDRARLGVRFNTLILPDTSRVSISTDAVYREGEAPSTSSSAKIGGGAIGGAILGAILGGGKGAAIGSGIGAAGGTAAAMAGDRRPVILPAGTPLSVRTQAPVTVTVEK